MGDNLPAAGANQWPPPAALAACLLLLVAGYAAALLRPPLPLGEVRVMTFAQPSPAAQSALPNE